MRAALLNMPSGVLNICSALFCGFMSRYLGMRFLWTVIVTCIGVMGAAIMGFLKNSQSGESITISIVSNVLTMV